MGSIKVLSFLVVVYIGFFFQSSVVGRLHRNVEISQEGCISSACRHTHYYDVCVSSLHSDPQSSSANLEGLARISLNLSILHAMKTMSDLKYMQSNNVNETYDAFMMECLGDCSDEYSDALENLQQAMEAMTQKDYATVNQLVSAAITDSDTCEDSFNESPGYVSPLTQSNRYFEKLCSNSLSIVSLLS